MLGVYIRHIEEGDSEHLIDLQNVDQIADLLKALKRHGVHCGGEVRFYFDTQFVCDPDDGAYFEVIVS